MSPPRRVTASFWHHVSPMNLWSSVAWLCVLIMVLIAFKREVQKAIFSLGFRLAGSRSDITARRRWAIILHYLVMWPGTFVHEFSHWLVGLLLGARPSPPQVQLKINRSSIELGSVTMTKVDPVRGSLIGAAPLVGGTLVILLLARLAFGVSLGANRSAAEGLAEVLTNLVRYAAAPDAWVWLYLIFAVSNSMLPSPSDRREWTRVVLALAIASITVVVLAGVPRFPPQVIDAVRYVIDTLGFAFGLTILVDVIVLAVLFVANTVAGLFQER